MNTATMDGSRALYALSEEKMTIKQLGVLNRHHVPARAMTVDMLLNIFLLLYFGNIFFILAAGNLGYMLSHVLALSGVLLLRKDRPELAETDQARASRGWWQPACSASRTCSSSSSASSSSPTPATSGTPTSPIRWPSSPRCSAWPLGSLACGVIGYVIAQRQHGRPFRWREPSDEQPSQEAIEAAAAPARAR